MSKGNDVLPPTVLHCMFAKAIFIQIAEEVRSWTSDREVHLLVHVSDVAKCKRLARRMYSIKIVELVGYLLREVTATFLVGYKPKPSFPRSVAIKVFNPVYKCFFPNQHSGKIQTYRLLLTAHCLLLTAHCSLFLLLTDPCSHLHISIRPDRAWYIFFWCANHLQQINFNSS